MSSTSLSARRASRRQRRQRARDERLEQELANGKVISQGHRIARGFLLTILALLIGISAYAQMCAQVGITSISGLPTAVIVLFAVIIVLILALQGLIAWRIPNAAHMLLPAITLLSLIGITMITRIDYGQRLSGQRTAVGQRQMVWLVTAVSLSCLLVLFLRDYRRLRRFSYVCMVVGLVLLLSPMLPVVGRDINGARIWLRIGPFSVQPAEFAKLFLAVFFAAYLFDHHDRLAVAGKKFAGIRWPRWKDFAPILIVWGVSLAILVLQHDLGTSLMFFAMFVGMLYVATGRGSWLLIGGVFTIVGVVAAWKLFPNFANRVTIWLHPFDQSLYTKQFGGTYQLVQGLFGLSSGGLFGTGLGQGHPGITPFANSDFIYTSLGEELGLVGLLAILVLYLTIITVGFWAALRVTDGFGKLLASGLMFSMAFQIFTVVGGITLVIPLTGLTLPYMAAGGSSLIANWILAILVLIISDSSHQTDSQLLLTDPRLRAEALQKSQEKKAAEQQEQQEEAHEDRHAARGKHAATATAGPSPAAPASAPAEGSRA